jgi:hypothetical protein
MLKRLLAFILSLILAFSLAACGKANTGDETIDSMSVKELGDALLDAFEDADALQSELDSANERIEELEKITAGVQGTDKILPAISVIEDGTGQKTFNTSSGKFALETSLVYPGSFALPQDGVTQLSKFRIAPSELWLVRRQGNKLELQSSDGGVYVVFYVFGTTEWVVGEDGKKQPEGLAALLDGVVEGLPASPGYGAGISGELVVNDKTRGAWAQVGTTIDSSPAVARLGICGVSEVGFSYVAVYKGEKNTLLEESLDGLFGTLTLGDNPVKWSK